MSDALSRGVLVVGIGAVTLGVVAMLAPGVAGSVAWPETLLSVFGLAALLQAARTANDFWNAQRRRVELPGARETRAATVAGEPFDRAFEASSHRGPVGRRRRRRIRRTLRRLAVSELAAETDDSAEAVRDRLDAGTWTDDPVAAALFTEEPGLTLRDRFRSALGRETTFQRRVRRAVAALEGHTGEDAGE